MSVGFAGLGILALAVGLVVIIVVILGVVWIALERREKHD